MSNLNTLCAGRDKWENAYNDNYERRSQELNPPLRVRVSGAVPPVGCQRFRHEECDGECEERIQPTDEERGDAEK